MNFTIFTPTRGRVSLLKEGLDKIQENTKFLDKVEAIYAVDDDDSETIKFFEENKDKYKFPVRHFIGPRPESLNAAINFLASQAKGRICTNINDDCLIITKNWDEIVLNNVEVYKKERGIKDDIFYIKTNDNSIDRDQSKGYCSFPMISKMSVNVLGMFMYSNFKSLGGDSSVYNLWKSVDRIIDCPEVEYDHVYHSSIFAVNAPDSVAYEMRVKNQENYIDPYSFDVSAEVKKLTDFINSYQKK